MAASSSAGHGFRGVSQKPNGKWDAQKVLNLDGKRKNLHNGQTHGTAEEAAHAFDWCAVFRPLEGCRQTLHAAGNP